jgi:ProP effector
LIWLAAHFPDAFDNTLRIRPLKVGIMDDVLTHAEKAAQVGISKSKLREAVVLFTRRLDYLTCLKAREMRIDLQGNPVAEVTEEEAECAASKIKKRVEKSLRNARKNTANRLGITAVSPGYTRQNKSFASSQDEHFPIYPARGTYHAQPSSSVKSNTEVVIKHKTTRQFDPDAVARLKEKLGLSRLPEQKNVLAEE